MLGQRDLYSSENRLNCFEVRNMDDDDYGNNNFIALCIFLPVTFVWIMLRYVRFFIIRISLHQYDKLVLFALFLFADLSRQENKLTFFYASSLAMEDRVII